MCTCGMDIATQHATPAIDRSTMSAFGVKPSGSSLFRRLTEEAAASISGGLIRRRKDRPTIETMQNIPTPT
jgi:hypothetical protein